MTETTNTTETPVRPADIVEQLRAAGVDRDLTIKVFECIETERAAAIAKAARLFYRPDCERNAMDVGDFSDELNTMSRRLWGLVAAFGDALGDCSDKVGSGVQQLAEDVAGDMERLAEAFDAEQWLARKQERQS